MNAFRSFFSCPIPLVCAIPIIVPVVCIPEIACAQTADDAANYAAEKEDASRPPGINLIATPPSQPVDPRTNLPKPTGRDGIDLVPRSGMSGNLMRGPSRETDGPAESWEYDGLGGMERSFLYDTSPLGGVPHPGITKEDIQRYNEQLARQKKQELLEQQMRRHREQRDFEIRESIREMIRRSFRESDVATKPSIPSKTGGDSPPGGDSPGSGGNDGAKEQTKADRPLTEKELQRQKNLKEAQERYKANLDKIYKSGNLFEPVPMEENLLRDGWCQLFDGKTFLGWRVQDDPASPYRGGRFFQKKSERGTIFCDPERPGLLYTTGQFGNASISLEYQCPEDAEVLLLLQSPPSPRDLHSSCYAVILNSAARRRGTILGRQQGTLVEAVDRLGPGEVKTTEESGQPWHRCVVLFDGGTVKVMIDRNEPVLLDDIAPLGYGHIGLLVGKGPAKFRNILWKPGASNSLFNGVDMDGWWYDDLGSNRPIPRDQLAHRLITRDLSLQLQGPAVLENKLEAANFSLQLEYNMVLPNGQAGVFFRAKRFTPATGYDCSLFNIPSLDDRLRIPVGCDAGGIRGLADARFLRPPDMKWNYLTINVVDRHVQTWINGVPVCDWGDLRPLGSGDAAPGKPGGPWLDPGTIQLHARTPGTTVQFRNIRLSPFLPRFYKRKSNTPTTWEDLNAARVEREARQRLENEMQNK
ncbi:MAG TPA: hypothetical protein DEB39_10320 [Planctomycetaceae bacterium]|nr:hypothetical protein [Planctomycetaceae bacterium]